MNTISKPAIAAAIGCSRKFLWVDDCFSGCRPSLGSVRESAQ